MGRPSSEWMARKNGFMMGSITAKMVQLLNSPMGTKIITSTERSGTMELRSWRGRKQRMRAPRKGRSARGLSISLRVNRFFLGGHPVLSFLILESLKRREVDLVIGR